MIEKVIAPGSGQKQDSVPIGLAGSIHIFSVIVEIDWTQADRGEKGGFFRREVGIKVLVSLFVEGNGLVVDFAELLCPEIGDHVGVG